MLNSVNAPQLSKRKGNCSGAERNQKFRTKALSYIHNIQRFAEETFSQAVRKYVWLGVAAESTEQSADGLEWKTQSGGSGRPHDTDGRKEGLQQRSRCCLVTMSLPLSAGVVFAQVCVAPMGAIHDPRRCHRLLDICEASAASSSLS